MTIEKLNPSTVVAIHSMKSEICSPVHIVEYPDGTFASLCGLPLDKVFGRLDDIVVEAAERLTGNLKDLRRMDALKTLMSLEGDDIKVVGLNQNGHMDSSKDLVSRMTEELEKFRAKTKTLQDSLPLLKEELTDMKLLCGMAPAPTTGSNVVNILANIFQPKAPEAEEPDEADEVPKAQVQDQPASDSKGPTEG